METPDFAISERRTRTDYFDRLNAGGRIVRAERFMLPEADMDKVGEHWGVAGVAVICAGDKKQMRRVSEKRRADDLAQVVQRLPIWC